MTLRPPPRWAWTAVFPFLGWGSYTLALGERRWEVVALMLFVTALALGGGAARRMLVGLYPLGLVALVYDAMRLVKHVGITPERVHICDLRAAEVRLFGVTVEGAPATVHDWLQPRASAALDLLCAVPYGAYLFAAIACALYLYARDFPALQRFGWTFFALNVAGFLTHHLWPAAPPWYYHAHGCAVDIATTASAGPNLARVDALLGFEYFRGLYGRSQDVFGALPSLHVAYPLLIVRETWRHTGALGRAATTSFAALMCFAAVYLDHHWVIDVVLGLAYGVALHALVTWVLRPRGAPALAAAAR